MNRFTRKKSSVKKKHRPGKGRRFGYQLAERSPGRKGGKITSSQSCRYAAKTRFAECRKRRFSRTRSHVHGLRSVRFSSQFSFHFAGMPRRPRALNIAENRMRYLVLSGARPEEFINKILAFVKFIFDPQAYADYGSGMPCRCSAREWSSCPPS